MLRDWIDRAIYEVIQPSGRTFVPFEASDIQFTHPILPSTALLANILSNPSSSEQGVVQESIDGALGATTVTTSVTPDGYYDWVIATSVYHTDPIARNLSLYIVGSAGIVAAVAGAVNNVPAICPRAMLIAPTLYLVGNVDAIAAGARLHIASTRLRLRLGTVPPN